MTKATWQAPDGSWSALCREQDDREAWLDARRDLVGASDVPAILGVSSFKSGLHIQQAKWGNDEDADSPEFEEMAKWGRKLEPLILAELGDELGRRVDSWGWLLQSNEFPFLGCTPDGIIAEGPHKGVFVQAKNALMAGQWELHENGMLSPARVWVQVQAEMAVTGHGHEVVACLQGGCQFRWAPIERDDLFIEETLVPTCREFWKRTAQGMPWTDGPVELVSDALADLYPQDDGETIALDASFMELDDHRCRYKRLEKYCKDRAKRIDIKIKEALGEATNGKLANGIRYEWKTNARGTRALNRRKR